MLTLKHQSTAATYQIQLGISTACLISRIRRNGSGDIPSKITPSRGGSRPIPSTRFLRPTRVHIPNNFLIGLSVFAGRTVTTNRLAKQQ